jgi:hypothetical protein
MRFRRCFMLVRLSSFDIWLGIFLPFFRHSSFVIRDSDHDRIALSHHSLHGSGHCCRGRSGGCNLSECPGAHWRDPQLRRIAGLFSGIGQFVLEVGRNSGSSDRRARVFHRVHTRHIHSVRLLVGVKIPCFDHCCDVSNDTLAAVCAGVSVARVLPILSILSGDHVSYRRAVDRCTALTTPIWRMSRMLV